MASKPSIPKGTRDFSPAEVAKRNYIISVMRSHFEKFGYQPIETPSFENSETLMGKYGEEGDRLIFKILNSGDYLDKVTSEELQTINYKKLTSKISEKALRYDLTVPFARYVVQNQNDIVFPFKRYQIQPVWRADRPQKGRFREFYQCDADVVGSTSLWQEVELVQLYDSVFTSLGLNGVTIKINNRKILSGIAEVIGASDKLIDFTVALDKLDKIGEDGVKKEMIEKGISEIALEKVQPLFSFSGTIQEKLEKLSGLLSTSEEGKKGIEELRFICDNVTKLGLQQSILDLDVTLARGLNYYTGAIFEVAPPAGIAMGSIGGGGRYDDLTGIFGLKDMSGVGISFGLDRIYLVLEELNLFPEAVTTSTQVLFLNFGENQCFEAVKSITALRNQNIKTEMYPDAAKIDKQFKYAERRNIRFVVKEIEGSKFTLKDTQTGEQVKVSFEELIAKISK
ncbi:histidine--tRNA ligase [Flavobacterium sp. N1994]|uniref:histidine--tRNA ligase n=1 Tax=Flavobacterium sp. N1994 TaxID=2986827 RepID=UPI002222D0DE|nr:histidine--tRNA ligase [Flavobacterium sp. N1994]